VENLPIAGRFPNLGACIVSYQEVLRSLFKDVNHQAYEEQDADRLYGTVLVVCLKTTMKMSG